MKYFKIIYYLLSSLFVTWYSFYIISGKWGEETVLPSLMIIFISLPISYIVSELMFYFKFLSPFSDIFYGYIIIFLSLFLGYVQWFKIFPYLFSIYKTRLKIKKKWSSKLISNIKKCASSISLRKHYLLMFSCLGNWNSGCNFKTYKKTCTVFFLHILCSNISYYIILDYYEELLKQKWSPQLLN